MQFDDLDNTYISPLHLFSYMRYDELDYEQAMELCYDVMLMCDELLVCSKISKGVEREIDLAIKCKMPVRYL